MRLVGILYDNISGNTGDVAIGLSIRKILREIGVEFRELVPGGFNPVDYERIIIGGGHLLRKSPDFFYDKFKIPGNHILNSCGILGHPDDLHYLDDYAYLSVRSTGDKRKLECLGKEVKVVPCTSMLIDDLENFNIEVESPSLGIHLTSWSLERQGEEDLIDWVSSLGFNVYFLPITHYNHDFMYLQKFKYRIKNASLLKIMTPQEISTTIGRFDYFISSSLHGAIFAYIHRVPFICLDSEKNRFFMEDRGLERYLFRDLSTMRLAFEELLNKRPDYSDRISRDRESLRKHIEALRKHLDTPKGRTLDGGKAKKMEVESIISQTNSQIHNLQMQVIDLEAQVRRCMSVPSVSLPWILKEMLERMSREKGQTADLEPLFVLLAVYLNRRDLQEAFPEVRQGNLENLLVWASDSRFEAESPERLLYPYHQLFVSRKEAIAASRTHALAAKENQISELMIKLNNLNSELAGTKSELASTKSELATIRESFGYRFMRFYAERIDRLSPQGTRRGRLRNSVKAGLNRVARKGVGSTVKSRE